MKLLASCVVACLSLLLLGGCAKFDRERSGLSAEEIATPLDRAEALYRQGDFTGAMIACIDVAHKDPLTPGLPALRNRIMAALTDLRQKDAQIRAESAKRQMTVELLAKKDLPDTYGVRRLVKGQEGSLRTGPTALEKALQRPVTLNLDQVNLDAFILAVGQAENISMIADTMDSSKTVTIHAEKVPLIEILDYVSRNLGVEFCFGENLIWVVSQPSGQSGIPLETRIYPLRKGLAGGELSVDDAAAKVSIEEIIQRFVPKVDGADLLFDKKTHVLVARNTRANLAKIEEIVEHFDVTPPQVLIEARFISTGVTDLRELGIDWILGSPATVTTKGILGNGVAMGAPETVVDSGNIVSFPPAANDTSGLNLTYRGLLTDPLFQAVLHALQISGNSRTLSAPKVMTLNNRPAKIRVGEDFRYFEEFEMQSLQTGTTSLGTPTYTSQVVPVGSPALEELGIELKVMPSVGADRRAVTLKLTPKIDEFERFEEYLMGSGGSSSAATNGVTNSTSLVRLPIFRRSEIETEVIVQSGETVVMGGLITSSETKTQNKVPVLGSLPLIGALFRSETVQEISQNLLIFVTATIVSEQGESLVPYTLYAPGTGPEDGRGEIAAADAGTNAIVAHGPVLPTADEAQALSASGAGKSAASADEGKK